MGSIIALSTENWDEEVLQTGQLVLVDFQVPWFMDYFVKDLKAENFFERWGSMVRVGTMDVTKFVEVAIRYRVLDIPTLVLIDHGRILKSFVGSRRVREMIRSVFTPSGLRGIGVLRD